MTFAVDLDALRKQVNKIFAHIMLPLLRKRPHYAVDLKHKPTLSLSHSQHTHNSHTLGYTLSHTGASGPSAALGQKRRKTGTWCSQSGSAGCCGERNRELRCLHPSPVEFEACVRSACQPAFAFCAQWCGWHRSVCRPQSRC